MDGDENQAAAAAATPRQPKDEAPKRTPMTANALFSIGKRKSVGWALQRASVLAGGSDEEEEDDLEDKRSSTEQPSFKGT